ncbi:MAG: hypothetical protein HYV95_03580 [Opitutae bacterium]|nr:hypothetical protein [Opitutae bacterium]
MDPDSHALAAQSSVFLLPNRHFFVRRIKLAPSADPSGQVELALEAQAPFPLEQLYHGYYLDAGRRYALVFAAHRKSFPAEQVAGWNAAAFVLPEAVFWCASRNRPGDPAVVVRRQADNIETVTWDEASELPAEFCSRCFDGQVLSECSGERQVSGTETPLLARQQASGAISILRAGERALFLVGPEGQRVALDTARLLTADVRDRAVLQSHRLAVRRQNLRWRVFVGALAGLAACLVWGATLAVSHRLLRQRREAVAIHRAEIRLIESAMELARRLDKVGRDQARPLEMLAVVNHRRPDSVGFLRVSTDGPFRMAIAAQTANAGDLRTLESALRQVPEIERAELHDPRTKDGLTTFSLDVTFKPGWFSPQVDS